MKTVVLALALAAGMLAMVMVLRGGVDLREAAMESPKGTVTVTRRYGPETVLNIAPHAAAERAASGQVHPLRGSPLIQEYRVTRQFAALFARLDAKSPRTPEENWLLAEILERCTRMLLASGSVPRVPPPPNREKALQTFAGTLSEKDPLRDKRLEAFKTVSADRCEGVRSASPNETRELRQAAAAGGDPKARVRLIHDELMAAPRNPDPTAPQELRDVAAHMDGIKAALESGEPNAVTNAANLLSLWGTNVSVRTGPDELPVNTDLFRRAAMVIACELGANCGPASDDMLYACAFHRACDIRDLREYYFFYALSPNQSQLMTQYVEGLRAVVSSRDWSHFAMRPGVPVQSWSVNP